MRTRYVNFAIFTGVCRVCLKKTHDVSFVVHGKEVGPLCKSCWKTHTVCHLCGEISQQSGCDCTKGSSKCVVCGKTKAGSSGLCDTCHSGYFRCEVCGQLHCRSSNAWDKVENQLYFPELFRNTLGGLCLTCFSRGTQNSTEKLERCRGCGSNTASVLESMDTEVHLCLDCLNYLRTCDYCSKITPNDLVVLNKSSSSLHVCSECISSDFVFCCMCNTYHRRDKDANKHKFLRKDLINSTYQLFVDVVLCKHCLSKSETCVGCGNCFYKESLKKLVSLTGTHYCCNHCSRTVGVCSECKELTSYYKNSLCRRCNALKNGEAEIKPYSFSPKPIFNGSGNLYLGFENETSFGKEADIYLGVVHIHTNFKESEVYVKSDSSINQGFEIVSHPFTFDAIKNSDWDRLFPTGCRKHASCGMHVHMSKSSFTTTHLFKFITFINNNPNFIRKIAQREENTYSQGFKSKLTTIAKDKRTPSRYIKVNLNKKHTVELRFFAHAVNSRIFLKNIEFAQSLWEFSKDSSMKNCSSTDGFIKYVKSCGKKFINLLNFLGEN